jgi:hypothetical protein
VIRTTLVLLLAAAAVAVLNFVLLAQASGDPVGRLHPMANVPNTPAVVHPVGGTVHGEHADD